MKLTIKKAHILVIIIGAIFISLSIFHSNIWFDESYSVALANHTFSEIWTIGGNDVRERYDKSRLVEDLEKLRNSRENER